MDSDAFFEKVRTIYEPYMQLPGFMFVLTSLITAMNQDSLINFTAMALSSMENAVELKKRHAYQADNADRFTVFKKNYRTLRP